MAKYAQPVLRFPHGRTAGCVLCVFASAATPLRAVETDDLANCLQENFSPLAVRACTLVLGGSNLEPALRVKVLMRRGRAWIMEEEPSAAVADYAKVLEIEPGNYDALKDRARAHSLAGKPDLAIEDWNILIEREPANDEHYLHRGASRLAAGQHQAALADYAKALELNPKAVRARIGRAFVYDALQDRENAKREFELAIAIDPNFIPIFWERGEMADRWGEKELAIESYVRCLKINGVYEDARRRLQKLGILTPP